MPRSCVWQLIAEKKKNLSAIAMLLVLGGKAFFVVCVLFNYVLFCARMGDVPRSPSIILQ